MKTNLTKIFAVALMSAGFIACGPVGQPNNMYGMNGQYGFNQFGNSLNNGMVGGSNCISQQGQQALSVGFTASGAAFNGNSGFYAGALPQTHARSGQYGNVTLSGGGMANQGGGIMINKNTMSGTIQAVVNPQSRTISGVIQVNPQGLYATGIMGMMYSQMPMNNAYPNQYNQYNQMNQYNQYNQYNQMNQYNQYNNMNSGICVTSIALDVTYNAGANGYGYQSNGVINNALVYLYLSNGQVAPMPVVF